MKNDKIPNYEFTDKLQSPMSYTPKNDSDDQNPKYMFGLTTTDLLVAIVKKHIDPAELAYKELRNRRLDSNGKWVGFNH